MRDDQLDAIWAERLRERCHAELLRQTRRGSAGRLLDSAAVVAVCAYLAAVVAVILRAASGYSILN